MQYYNNLVLFFLAFFFAKANAQDLQDWGKYEGVKKEAILRIEKHRKGDATLKYWDVKDDLKNISVPTLSIGATYDTMDPEQMEFIANEVQNGRFLLCPNGSHLAQFDDQKIYFEGLIKFIKDVDRGTF